MKGDFTRFSHQPEEHYAAVLMQQGRVTLDADWNEQFDIDDHRWRAQTIDTIGRACAPEGNAGFALSFTPDLQDLIIGPGRIYIDGILVEVLDGTAARVISIEAEELEVADDAPDGQPFEIGQWVEVLSDETEEDGGPARTVAMIDSVTPLPPDPDESDAPVLAIGLSADAGSHAGQTNVRVRRIVTYLTQPFYPAGGGQQFADSFDPLRWAGQTHLVYLDVWRRHVTAIEDPDIREVALGGPDTATRVQTVWALRIMRDSERQGEPAQVPELSCSDDHPLWDELIEPSGGRLSARAEAAPDEENPCAVQPGAGYRGLENRLYRVEIHDPGPIGTATYKWSSNNGTVLSSIVDFPQVDEVEVHSLGKDRVLRFDANNRVEAFSEITELAGAPGTMASIVGQPDEADRTISLDQDVSLYDGHPVARLRKWDHGVSEPVTSAPWVELELGVQVRFGGDDFRVGDYWVIPARVATGTVVGFIDAPARGITHHFARIALVTWPTPAGGGSILDCRHTFPPLCEITGGDGDHCCTVSVGEGGDFATLQEAVNSLEDVEGPARICILPGEHRFVGPTVISRDELTISGCGRTSRLRATSGTALLFENSREVRIEDLWIFSESGAPTIHGISVSQFEVIDCHIFNGGPRRDFQGPDDLVGFADNTVVNTDFPGRREAFAFDDVQSRVLVGDPDVTARRGVGPGIRVDEGQIVILRDNLFQAGPAAVSFRGVGFWFEHNLVVRGGVHVRESSEFVSIKSNTIANGASQGVLLGGIEKGEDRSDERAGMGSVVIASNLIEQMGREGISTDIALRSEIERLTIVDNRVRKCGTEPLSDQFSIGGGILVTDASDVVIRGNRIAQNGPDDEQSRNLSVGFGIVAAMTTGLAVHENTIVDNGGRNAERNLNVGLMGIAVMGFESDSDSLVLGPPAASVTGNSIECPEGPAVVLLAVGPVAVNNNTISSSYRNPSVLDFGRAMLILNLGAAPDTGLVSFGKAAVQWPLRHGRVMLADNQITVQARPDGLPPLETDFDPLKADAGDLVEGSSVAVFTLDDLSLNGNQILSETDLHPGAAPRPMRSAVWAAASTLRATDNRITEVIETALFSYVGVGLAQIVTDNITTHCIRAEAVQLLEDHNISLNCERDRVGSFIDHRVWRG
jgi:hypothetical protein